MRNCRPCYKKFRTADAHLKESLGRKQLGRLEARTVPTPTLAFGAWKRRRADGSEIRVMTMPNPTGGMPVRIIKVGTPEGTEEEVYIQCIMETGLLVIAVNLFGEPLAFSSWEDPWAGAAAAGLIPPLLIYTGDDLQTYLEGAGTAIPGLNKDEFLLQGEEEGRACPQDSEKSLTDWPDLAPQLEGPLQTAMGFSAYEAYSSTIYVQYQDLFLFSKYCHSPGLFTGLLKLAVQAKLGSGNTPAQLAAWSDTSCGLQRDRDGLFRGTNGIYWLVRIDETGCFAHRMEVAKCAQCIDAMLADGLVPDEDLIEFQAHVFAALRPSNGYSDVTLLTAEQLAEIYEVDASAPSNRIREPLGDAGWAYSHGHFGTGDGAVYEASMITHELFNDLVTQYRLATHYKVTFDFSGTTPSATLSKPEENVQWEPSIRDWIYYPSEGIDGYKICYVQRQDHSDDSGSDAPLFCWYMPEGIEVVSYTRRVNGTAGAAGASHGPLCGAGVYHHLRIRPGSGGSATKNGSVQTRRTGYTLNTKEPNSSSTWTYDTMHKEAWTTGSCSYTGNPPSQASIWANSALCNDDDSSSWPGPSYQVDMHYGDGDGWRDEVIVIGATVDRFIIRPHGERECAYLIEMIYSPAIERKYEHVYSSVSGFPGNYVLWTQTDLAKASAGFSTSILSEINPGGAIQQGVCGGKSFTSNLKNDGHGGAVKHGTEWAEIFGGLVTNHGVFTVEDGYLSADYTGWSEWVAYTLDPLSRCGSTEMWTQVSYQYPEVYYSFGPSILKSMVGEAGWPANSDNEGYAINAPGLLSNVAFIGWN